MVNEPHTRWIVKWFSRIVDGNVKDITNTPELPDEVDQIGSAFFMEGRRTKNSW